MCLRKRRRKKKKRGSKSRSGPVEQESGSFQGIVTGKMIQEAKRCYFAPCLNMQTSICYGKKEKQKTEDITHSGTCGKQNIIIIVSFEMYHTIVSSPL